MFFTGQAARLLIGQPVWSAQSEGISERLLGTLSAVSYANGSLYVADANRLGGTPDNNRILIYGNIASVMPGLRDELPVNDAVRCPVCLGIGTVVLGQPDFATANTYLTPQSPANNTLRDPTGLHCNGQMLAVADTDYNRVLIWKTPPVAINQPADLVIGQPDFATASPGIAANKLRGPMGVWLDANNGLWVADAGNDRVLYFGVPNSNGQSAVLVLGQNNFNTDIQPALVGGTQVINSSSLLTPASVTTDGQRLYVADLGHNRVLIWNSIPTKNNQASDIVLGQKDFVTATANDAPNLCASNGTDSNGNPTYPYLCNRTMSFPRYALSDGTLLYVSDSGNDRVLVYNQIPTASSVPADEILGQQSDVFNTSSDSNFPERVSASDSFKTPGGLATDGTNLYVADIYNRRIMVFTPADFNIGINSVRNAASLEVYAVGTLTFSTSNTDNSIEVGDVLTVTIGNGNTANDINYTYTTVSTDTLTTLVNQFVSLINAGNGDPNVLATPDTTLDEIILTARTGGPDGNNVTLVVTTAGPGNTTASPVNSKTSITLSGANLSGGQDAARIAPYSLLSILGTNYSDGTGDAPLTETLPRDIAGVQVYIDGFRAPIQSVAPDKITAQIPAGVSDSTSASLYIRVTHKDGNVDVSAPIAVLLIADNPGVYAVPGPDPRVAIATHASSSATGTVAVDGSIVAGDVGVIYLNERPYTYVVSDVDTLDSITNAFIDLINGSDPEVMATRALPFTTIRLKARVAGPQGDNITLRISNANATGLVLTALNTSLCCANIEGAPVTPDNPAIAGEQIVVYATGLGLLQGEAAVAAMLPGQPYNGPEVVQPVDFVSSLVGGRTARVITCNILPGSVGLYQVTLELSNGLPTDPFTQGTIAQSFQVSNIFTIPVVSPTSQ